MLRPILAATVLVFGLAACDIAPTNRGAIDETLITTEATVTSVDKSTRRIGMTDVNTGEQLLLTAGPEVQNFDQIAVGDTIRAEFYSAVALSFESEENTETPDALAGASTVRADPGAKPAAAAVVFTDIPVTVLSYDDRNFRARIRLPSGEERTVTVPPRLRDFASRTNPGSTVVVSFTDAVAVAVTSTPGA